MPTTGRPRAKPAGGHELGEPPLESPAGNYECGLKLLYRRPFRVPFDGADDILRQVRIGRASHGQFWRDFLESRQYIPNKNSQLGYFWRDYGNRARKWRDCAFEHDVGVAAARQPRRDDLRPSEITSGRPSLAMTGLARLCVDRCLRERLHPGRVRSQRHCR